MQQKTREIIHSSSLGQQVQLAKAQEEKSTIQPGSRSLPIARGAVTKHPNLQTRNTRTLHAGKQETDKERTVKGEVLEAWEAHPKGDKA